MDEAIQVPSALIKLERMRAKANAFHAVNRELQDRVNGLHGWLLALNKQNEELERFVPARSMPAPGTRTNADQINANTRTIAAVTAMLEVAKAALKANQGHGDDARLYDSMCKHLASELHAWGVE